MDVSNRDLETARMRYRAWKQLGTNEVRDSTYSGGVGQHDLDTCDMIDAYLNEHLLEDTVGPSDMENSMRTETHDIVAKLRDRDYCDYGDVDDAADMLEFLLDQLQMHSPKMDGNHSYRFRNGWP